MPAPGGWFYCDIIRAGQAEDGRVYIGLRDRAESWPGWRWYYAVEGYKREMLATALTAVSTGYPVDAALVSTDDYSQINRLYVGRPG